MLLDQNKEHDLIGTGDMERQTTEKYGVNNGHIRNIQEEIAFQDNLR